VNKTIQAGESVLQELVLANRILANEGVFDDALGHVSVRHPAQPDVYVISRSLGPALVTTADLQYFSLDGRELNGDTRPAYAERAIHGAIYEARSEVMAVCHNHAPATIPFGVTGVLLRPVYHMAGMIGTDIPVWDIQDEFGDTDLLVRTLEQGRSLARTLGPRRVALMRGHGNVVAGRTLREAVMAAIYLDRNARIQLQALSLGEAHCLSEGESARTAETQLGDFVLERVWTYWTARVGR
jgi:HCOMODA/2-hydroxy-3-carboxy-muconic semialdehyde decarboxylase